MAVSNIRADGRGGQRDSRGILVYRLGSLGDFLLALPALRVVREANLSAKITLLTNFPVSGRASSAMTVLEGTGVVDDYMEYPAKTRNVMSLLTLLRKIRASRFDQVVSLASTRSRWDRWRDACFFRLAGIHDQVGFARSEAAPHRVYSHGTVEHEAVMLLRRVNRWNNNMPMDFDLRLSHIERRDARKRLLAAQVGGPFIAASIGTKLEIKDWGQMNWLGMLRELTSKVGSECGLVVVGASDERTRSDECLAQWKGATLNLCGDLSPRQSAAVLSFAHVFVGHDSGPMHLAAATGVPCVALFSGRAPRGKWFPLGRDNTVLYKMTACNSCGLDVCIAEAKKCIMAISPAEVIAAVEATYRKRAATFNSA